MKNLRFDTLNKKGRLPVFCVNLSVFMKRVTKIVLTVLIPTSLVGAYLGAGFYLVPNWLKQHLPELIKNETGLQTSLSTAAFNPLSFDLALHDFEVDKLLQFEKLDMQLNFYESLATKTLVIDHILFEKPVFNLKKNSDGSFNTDVFATKKDASEPENTAIFPVTVKNFMLSQGHFLFQDDKISTQITPLNLTITNFSVVDTTPAKFNLTALWQNGGEVALNGEFLFSTLTTKGNLTFKNFSLPDLLVFLPENKIELKGNGELVLDYHFEFKDNSSIIKVENGALSLTDLTYQQLKLQKFTLDNFTFDSLTNQLELKNLVANTFEFKTNSIQLNLPKLTLNELSFNLQNQLLQFKTLVLDTLRLSQGAAQFDLLNLTVSNANFSVPNQLMQTSQISLIDAQLFDTSHNTLLFRLPQLDLKKLALDFNKKTFFVDAIQAKNADFKAWLNPNGELNYQTLLPEDEAQVASEKAAGNETSEAFWGIKVASVELDDFSASFEDKTLATPSTININPLSLKLTELSNEAGAKLPFELRTGINDSGALHLKGHAGLNPLSAQTQIDVKALGLEKFQSYVDKFAHFDLIKGVFNLDGKLDIAKGQQGELDIKFKGNTGIARLITRDQKQNKDLVKWDNLTFKNVEADVLAQRYSASALLIEKPYARVVIDKNKTLNFTDILIDSKPEMVTKNSKKTQQNASPDVSFTLDKLKISNGSSSFSDLSLILPFSAEIRGLEGGAAGISSKHESTINLNLKGNAYDIAPVDIKGKIQPFIGDYTAALHFRGMPLPLMSSYMAEFAGYKFEKGKMSLGMNYEVINGELNATNNLKMEQIELGEKIDNPHAIDAPIDLAITLLKDMDGTINLDLPITGSLNDPQFSFSGIVTDALLNVISKTITSPFQAIASLIGTEDDLSAVQFSPGSAELNEWQKPKVDGLAKVLQERSTLKIEIKGTAFESQDWAFLREEVLTDRLKALRAEELNRKNKQKILPEYVELEDDDAQRLLAQEFRARFPHLVKKSFLGRLELTNPEMGEFYNVAKKQLLDEMPVEYKRLNKLAAARAKVLAQYLVGQGVPDERIFILSPAVDPPRTDNDIDALLFLKTE